MHIGTFERETGLPRTTIRFYERLGLLTPGESAKGSGYRFYGEEHVERVRLVKLAQSLGFSIREIRDLMDAYEKQSLTTEAKKRILAEKVAEIDGKLAALAAMRGYLAAKIAWIDNGETGPAPRLDEPQTKPARQRQQARASAEGRA